MEICKSNIAQSDLNWEFLDGSKRSATKLKTCAVGLGTYNVGWRWSTHVGAINGKEAENHIGYILSGAMIIQDKEGNQLEVGAGEAFEIGEGGDAWVEGDEACIALDFIPC